jgi:hypothetical protein
MIHARFSHRACVLSTPFCEKLFSPSPASLAGVRLQRSCVKAGSSTIRKFYNDHSNATLVTVNGNRIDYEVFRIRKLKRGESTGSYQA